eukprot:scaffold150309_cov20-Tisochrysis_lutea.AAC.1
MFVPMLDQWRSVSQAHKLASSFEGPEACIVDPPIRITLMDSSASHVQHDGSGPPGVCPQKDPRHHFPCSGAAIPFS